MSSSSSTRLPTSSSSSSSSASLPVSWSTIGLVAGAVGASLVTAGIAAHTYYSRQLNELKQQLRQSQQQQELSGGPSSILLSSPFLGASSSPTLSPRTHRSSLDLRPKKDAVVVVDPVSTGANVAFEVFHRGYPCIKVLSGYVNATLMNLVDPSIQTQFVAEVAHDSANPQKTVLDLTALPFNIIAVISGSELGIEVTDYLSEMLGCPSNGLELTNCRRDKYQMGECIRRAGVRAVRQSRVQHWHEVEKFIADFNSSTFPKIVLKPIRSAGSDHVYLCDTKDEAEKRFAEVMGAKNQLGFVNEAVVAQEYLEGTEYVVDSASRNGKHKIVAIWQYDKRKTNGYNFVYFGMSSVSGESQEGKVLTSYFRRVLDALNIRHGAAHGEVIMTKTGPCLVEVGARCHGAEGTFIPLADRCWGYNQVQALVTATVDDQGFNALPDVCGEMKEYGFKVDLVSSVTGVLDHLQHVDEIENMKSFLRYDLLPQKGDKIPITIDCFTAVGSITLVHKDRAVVEADHERIRELEKTMFVVVPEEKAEKKSNH